MNIITDSMDSSAFRELLEAFIADFDRASGAVLASADGLHIAHAVRVRGIETESVAAMSASMLSLADAMAEQAGNAHADKLISEAESSTMVVLHAGPLILTVVGTPGVNSGLIFAAARRTAEDVAALVERLGGKVIGNEPVTDPAALIDKARRDVEKMYLVKGVG